MTLLMNASVYILHMVGFHYYSLVYLYTYVNDCMSTKLFYEYIFSLVFLSLK